jgi:cell division septal protein FtsQ
VVNERIASRRAEVRSARRLRRLRRTIAVGVLAAVVIGGIALERSSLVALASIDVQGLERLDEAAVLDAAEVAEGTSVLRLRLGGIRDAIVALPLVDDAVVERDGALGLRIVVDEAAPALTAVYDDTRLLVSEEGLVLGEGEAPGTPVVVVVNGFVARERH